MGRLSAFSVLACWLSQNTQNKIITILFFAQYSCRNKSSPIRTSHNNAFVARVSLSLDFAICLFPQFFTSMLPLFRSFAKVEARFRSETRFFPRVLPKTAVLHTVLYCFCNLGATWKWFSRFSAERREFSKSVFRPCFPKSLARKTLLRLSAPPLRLSAPGGGKGVGREAKNALFALKTLNRIAVFFFCLVPGFSWIFLGFLLASVVSVWFPGIFWVSAYFCCFC